MIEPKTFISQFFEEAEEWCRGRMWIFRSLLFILMGYIFLRHLFNPEYQSLFKGLNLGIHELGHFVFMFFGQFITAAGGTILQLLVPLIGVVMFYRQRDYFAIAVAFCWFATNWFDVAVYVGDARDLMLPLVSPFGGGEDDDGTAGHDWNYMLGELGLLEWDTRFATLARLLGIGSMLIGLIFGAWLLFKMITLEKDSRRLFRE
jgi:hypothetical protein